LPAETASLLRKNEKPPRGGLSENLTGFIWSGSERRSLLLPAPGKQTHHAEAGRCEQYLAMPMDQSRDFSAWMSGWFSYKLGKTWVDLVAYRKNIENVKAWRKSLV